MANINTQSIRKEPYYHGWLPQHEIRRELCHNKGDFLIRLADPRPGRQLTYALSVHHGGDDYKHYRINHRDGKYFIAKYSFDTIQQMVEYHVALQASIQDNVVIKTAINRKTPTAWEPELPHGSIKKVEEEPIPILLHDIYFGWYVTPDGKETLAAIRRAKLDTAKVEEIRAVLDEARVLAHLHHPHIIHYFGCTIATLNKVYMATELSEEGPLNYYLKKNPTLPMTRLNELCLDVAWGLEYLHRKGYMHRELNTYHCFVVNGKVKIYDFKYTVKRCVYLVPESEAVAARWTAPEVFRSRICYRESDIWSFGVLCWEVYNYGKQPYEGITAADVVLKVRDQGYRLQFPDTVNKEIVDTITTICWSEKLNQRLSMYNIAKVFERITGKQAPDMGAMDPEIKAKIEKFKAEMEQKKKEMEKKKKTGFFGFFKKK